MTKQAGALPPLKTLDLTIEDKPVEGLKPYAVNARTHSKKQIVQIAASIRQFGFVNPVLVDSDDQIIAGHGRVEAAKTLGMTTVPTVRLDHLSAAQRRAYVIADNRLAELAGWDRDILRLELQGLVEMDLDFDLEITGFETAELDLLLDGPSEAGLDPTQARLDQFPHKSRRELKDLLADGHVGNIQMFESFCDFNFIRGWVSRLTHEYEATRPDNLVNQLLLLNHEQRSGEQAVYTVESLRQPFARFSAVENCLGLRA